VVDHVVGDLAQGDDRVLVVVAVDQQRAPAEMARARCADSRTSEKRFGTFSTQSSTVTRAMNSSGIEPNKIEAGELLCNAA
jgi:hypothetical protein